MIYQHPLAYLVGIEGLALLRAWGGEYDEQFVRERLEEVRRLLDDETLQRHPGVRVEPGATADAYRQWAPTYDDPGNQLLTIDLPVIDAILDLVPRGTAADIACGTGRLAQRLAGRGHRVVGIDGSVAMLQQARRNVPGVPFVVGDLAALPLADGSTDLVTTALALAHVADLRAVLAEFARVLKPGGVAIISDVHPDLVFLGSTPKAEGRSGPQLAASHRHTVSDYLRAVLSVGFRVRGFTELTSSREESTTGDSGAVPRELGSWREWPWTLLPWAPEAARAAWCIPSLLVWHLQLDG